MNNPLAIDRNISLAKTDKLVLSLVNRLRLKRGRRVIGDRNPLTAEASPSALIAIYCQYSGVPPYAVGKEGSKVIESVSRSFEYNRKEEKESQLLTQEEEKEKLSNKEYWRETVGCCFPTFLKESMEQYVKKHHTAIDQAAKKTVSQIRKTLPSILTKGRQTWCPLLRRSVPSPQAFQNMMNFYQRNLKKHPRTSLDWIRLYFECMNLPKIQYTGRKQAMVKHNVKGADGQIRIIYKRVIQVDNNIVIENTEDEPNKVYKHMMEMLTSFCGYLKSKERNKLNRRAIASPNIVLRMFFYVYELFCLNLSDLLNSSMISIGGEKKKQRIIATLDSVHSSVTIQGTEDATKWNECLSSEGFYAIPHFFLSNEVRTSLRLPKVTKEFDIIREIMKKTTYLLHSKRVYLGEGHKTIDEYDYVSSRFDWKPEHKQFMNTTTREAFSKVENWVEDNYLKAPCGMLMGMFNAGSTIYGLVGSIGLGDHIGTVETVRSSDDSMSIYMGETRDELLENIRMHNITLKSMGVNPSEDKTRYFHTGFGEVTSMYFDDAFQAQYGTEIPSCRPSAQNPHDDFHTLSKNTHVKLRENTLNPIGAYAYLRLGERGVMRLYKIKKSDFREIVAMGVDPEAVLMSGGGPSPWNVSNCGLSEIVLKIRHCENKELRGFPMNEITKKYFAVVTDAETPMTAMPSMQYSYNIETAQMESVMPTIPRNLYTTQSKNNSTQRSSDSKQETLYMKSCQALNQLIMTIKPIVEFKPLGTNALLSRVVCNKINEVLANNPVSNDVKDYLNRFMSIISNEHYDEDYLDLNYDEDENV